MGTLLVALGTILVTGMIAHVTAAAAIGRRLNLGEAWAATRGKRWRLVGLAFLLGLALALMSGLYALAWVLVVLADNTGLAVAWGVVTVPAFMCLLVWFWVRVYYLPVPALMLEPVGVFGAIRRGFALTRRQFWRTLGIALLTVLIVGFAGQVLTFPIGLVGNIISLTVPPQYALLVIVVTQAVAQVISAAFVTPFSAAVTSLQYLDQRMRKEAYDVELMQQAGITRVVIVPTLAQLGVPRGRPAAGPVGRGGAVRAAPRAAQAGVPRATTSPRRSGTGSSAASTRGCRRPPTRRRCPRWRRW